MVLPLSYSAQYVQKTPPDKMKRGIFLPVLLAILVIDFGKGIKVNKKARDQIGQEEFDICFSYNCTRCLSWKPKY
jgi:hypothetical protein